MRGFQHGFLGALCVIVAVLGLPNVSRVSADDSCPWFNKAGWAQDSTVRYVLHQDANLGAVEVEEATTSFQTWSLANRMNCSRVTFEPGGNSFEVFASAGVLSPTVTYAVARTESFPGPGPVTMADTTFYWGAYKIEGGVRLNGWNRNNSNTFRRAVRKSMLHEIGHTMGLGEAFGTGGSSVMNQFGNTNDSANQVSTRVTQCDNNAVRLQPRYISRCYTSQLPVVAACYAPNGEGICPVGTTFTQPQTGNTVCCYPSPIIIDLDNDAFNLTDESGGVLFDIGGDGSAEQVSWTDSAADDAWLCLDRNGNGTVDNGMELFGNFTDQELAPGQDANGFNALALFDQPKYAGNGDGRISSSDGAFEYLRLWVDSNHDGISQPAELSTLPSNNLVNVSLSYQQWRHSDPNGNYFKYASTAVFNHNGTPVEHVAGDVYLLTNGGPGGGGFGRIFGGSESPVVGEQAGILRRQVRGRR